MDKRQSNRSDVGSIGLLPSVLPESQKQADKTAHVGGVGSPGYLSRQGGGPLFYREHNTS